MNTKIVFPVIFTCCFTLDTMSVAQPGIVAYCDLGKTNVSNGIFARSACLGGYQYGDYRLETGLQFNLNSRYKNTFSGINVKASKDLMIHKHPIEIQGLFIWAPVTPIVCETNWGLLFKMQHGHFKFMLGNSFRTFYYSQHARRDYAIEGNPRIRENLNLVYSFNYNVRQPGNPWNIGLSVTNIDNFLISQETNPVYKMHAFCQVTQSTNLFSEAWLITAGSANLHVNSFGYFFRTGIIWNVNSTKR